MTDAGLIVLVSLISPFRAERELACAIVEPELVLTGHDVAPATLAERVVNLLRQRHIVD